MVRFGLHPGAGDVLAEPVINPRSTRAPRSDRQSGSLRRIRLREAVAVAIGGVLAASGLVAVAAGPAAADTNGPAYGWGRNDFGQIGDGNTGTNTNVPTAVSGGLTFTQMSSSDGTTCGLAAGGAAYCWGYNGQGQLGDGNIGTDTDVPTAVSGGLTFTWLSTGGRTTCGVAAGGAAYCWGYNNYGQLGDGNTGTDTNVPTAVSGGLTFRQISSAAGASATCGLVSGGAAYCWGANNYGQLGDGNTGTDTNVPTAVSGGLTFTQISSGWLFACGVASGGAAYCWGYNNYGNLGDGNTGTDTNVPTAVSGGLTFTQISAGSGLWACGVASGGAAYCWGYNNYGQLGDGNTGTDTNVPTAVSGGLTFTQISADSGYDTSCGVASGGAAYCWGYNNYGQLGDGNTGTDTNVPTAVSGGLTFTQIYAGFETTVGITSPVAGPLTFSSGAFPAATVGTAAVLALTVTNTGSGPATPSAITAAGAGVAVTGGTCATATPIAAGGTCTVALAWTPAAAGALAGGSLTVAYPDGASASDAVALTGTATAAGGGGAAQTPEAGCVTAGGVIPRQGTKSLATPGCVTNANQRVGVRVRAAQRMTTRGDVIFYSLFCQVSKKKTTVTSATRYGDGSRYCKKGTLKIRTYGLRLRIRITWTAPATGTYTAYAYTKTYNT